MAGHDQFIKETIELAKENVKVGGRPFATVIVKDNKVLCKAANQVAQTRDPTAHAEIVAIQQGSKILNSEHFVGCTFYILAHACPMCMAAMYYASPDKVIFITTRDEYSAHYVDHRKYMTLYDFYEQVGKPWQERAMPMEHHPDKEAIEVYKLWEELNVKQKLFPHQDAERLRFEKK